MFSEIKATAFVEVVLLSLQIFPLSIHIAVLNTRCYNDFGLFDNLLMSGTNVIHVTNKYT